MLSASTLAEDLHCRRRRLDRTTIFLDRLATPLGCRLPPRAPPEDRCWCVIFC